jgi:hypothetical protein
MIAAGTDLELVTGPIGTLAHEHATVCEPERAQQGDRATYCRPYAEAAEWHLVLVVAEGRPLFAAVHESMFAVRDA